MPRFMLMRRFSAVAIAVLVLGGCGEPASDTIASGTAAPTTTAPSTTSRSLPSSTSSIPTTTLPASTTIVVGEGSGLVIVPGESGDLDLDLQIGCPSGPTFPVSALQAVVPLEGAGRADVEAAIAPFLESGEGDLWPQAGWQLLHETADTVIIVHVEPIEPTVAFMEIALEEGEWKWAGSQLGGSCPLETRIPEGLNGVDWRLDPDAEPLGSQSTSIHLLATERQCVSGQPMGERLRAPHVVVTDDQVRIAMAADPPDGEFQTCPGNPDQVIVIDLGMPLGNREVVDGLAVLGTLEDLIG